jgi:NADPH:quinone reductase-like Zn-dependent oxidoreductase
VQLAARLGAHIIATASARNHAYLYELGASEVIDYTQTDMVAAVRATHPEGIDAVLGERRRHAASRRCGMGDSWSPSSIWSR